MIIIFFRIIVFMIMYHSVKFDGSIIIISDFMRGLPQEQPPGPRHPQNTPAWIGLIRISELAYIIDYINNDRNLMTSATSMASNGNIMASPLIRVSELTYIIDYVNKSQFNDICDRYNMAAYLHRN